MYFSEKVDFLEKSFGTIYGTSSREFLGIFKTFFFPFCAAVYPEIASTGD